MEVLLKSNTSIVESPKKIEVSSVEFEDTTPSHVTLSELQSMDTYKHITVEIKVLKLTEIETVSSGKKARCSHCR